MASKIVNNQERHDWVEYPVQDDVRLEVYWRRTRVVVDPQPLYISMMTRFCGSTVLAVTRAIVM